MLVIGSVFSQIFRSVIGDVNWTPSSIFYDGAPGVWYDPSDLATLFQDSAGVTPVTTPGQTVGMMLDKSQGLVLGTERLTNGNFSDGSTGWTVTGSDATHIATFSGGTLRYQSDTTTPVLNVAQAGALVIGKTYLITVVTSAYTSGSIKSDNFGSAMVLSNGLGTRTLRVTASATNFTLLRNTVNVDITIDSISIKEIAGNHATQATLAQRPTYQIDSNGKPYLLFDGVDDGMVTNTITPATNKVQVFAGLRKLSDTAQKIVAEMSATITSNAGAFALTAPNSAAANYNFSSKGTTQTDNVVTTYTAPITSVISGLGDIAGASNLIRVNGSQVGAVLTTQGTGNYLAYPLYIGRRAGASLPFNGSIYSMIVCFGPNLTTGQITSAETYVNEKTGAY
jgi:hypothetical protein